MYHLYIVYVRVPLLIPNPELLCADESQSRLRNLGTTGKYAHKILLEWSSIINHQVYDTFDILYMTQLC